mmetsp:Transcript_89257/g.199633  ORF Transcript_89257/g.199633 Transcript_89257/m.199633 type:complete len:217 (-) Transcript_89257:91-741(-)
MNRKASVGALPAVESSVLEREGVAALRCEGHTDVLEVGIKGLLQELDLGHQPLGVEQQGVHVHGAGVALHAQEAIDELLDLYLAALVVVEHQEDALRLQDVEVEQLHLRREAGVLKLRLELGLRDGPRAVGVGLAENRHELLDRLRLVHEALLDDQFGVNAGDVGGLLDKHRREDIQQTENREDDEHDVRDDVDARDVDERLGEVSPVRAARDRHE